MGEAMADSRGLMVDSREEATETYVGLLVGDLQIRRAIGVLGPRGDTDLHRRSDRASG